MLLYYVTRYGKIMMWMTKDFTVVYIVGQKHHNPLGCLLKMHIPGPTESGFLGYFSPSLTRSPGVPSAH